MNGARRRLRGTPAGAALSHSNLAVDVMGTMRPLARLRIILRDGAAIGPGKVDLLEGIHETGSIAAAGRRMGMSYKRAWSLTETLNGYFDMPLAETAKGGARGGGARLTPLGEEVLRRYRQMEADAASALAKDLKALGRRVT